MLRCSVNVVANFARYRLTNDGGFRRVREDASLAAADVVCSDTSSAYVVCASLPPTITLDGKRVPVRDPDAEFVSIADPAARPAVLVHRQVAPPTPTRRAVRDAIASGNDGQTNTLLVRLNGTVALEPRSGLNIENPDYALRLEAYDAGNEYVGRQAAEDSRHVDNAWLMVLFGWREHLKSGMLGYYSDLIPSEDPTGLVDDITRVKPLD